MSYDGNCILAGCLDSTLLLDRSTGELLQEYKGHINKSYKLDCCLTNNDAYVTDGSEDGYIYFWDLVDASAVSRFRAHTSVVTSVSYHPKENCICGWHHSSMEDLKGQNASTNLLPSCVHMGHTETRSSTVAARYSRSSIHSSVQPLHHPSLFLFNERPDLLHNATDTEDLNPDIPLYHF